MAIISTIEHFLSDDEYEVSKDDYSRSRKFSNYEDAKEYYEYLKSEEVQESIAKNQATAIGQNNEIIANQRRLLEIQARNNQIPSRPPVTRQVLDPEYQEWLQFKKETDPAYLKWKKEKEEREAAERARKQKERTIAALGMKEERILKIATAINQCTCSVKTNKGLTWKIIESRIYTFSNVSVIQDILDIIDNEEKFRIFWDQYKSYTDIIIKSASLHYADANILWQLRNMYRNDENAIRLIDKNSYIR